MTIDYTAAGLGLTIDVKRLVERRFHPSRKSNADSSCEIYVCRKHTTFSRVGLQNVKYLPK